VARSTIGRDLSMPIPTSTGAVPVEECVGPGSPASVEPEPHARIGLPGCHERGAERGEQQLA
jgi:hypothetical protein